MCNKVSSIVEYCKKETISDKNKARKRKKSIYIGKKTIQMSNFHNPAEIDINLTGRKKQ